MAAFDPLHCQFSGYPGIAKSSIGAFAQGPTVGYLQGVLRCRCGRYEIPLGPAGSVYTFDGATYLAVKDLQAFFKLPVTGFVNGATWAVVDYLATH